MGQLNDDTKITTAALMDRIPEYVARILAGAQIKENWGGDDEVELISDESVFLMKKAAFDTVLRVKDEVAKICETAGIYPPYSAENIITIISRAAWVARAMVKIPPHKLRVMFPYFTDDGCSFYRVLQPQKYLAMLGEQTPIHSELTEYFSIGAAKCDDFDVVVAHRPSNKIAQMLRDVISCGKVVVYESDDLLTDMPNFNPARMFINPDDWHYALIQKAHGRIVSTEQLAEALSVVDNTHVVHNGIDPTMWPLRLPQQPAQGQPVRILWAGGNTHSGDLKMITDPIRRLIKNYGTRCMFVFVGYLPEDFQDSRNNQFVNPAWQKWVQYHPPVSIWDWPGYLAKSGCHIAIAPLVKHPFNESKSELKALEAWALGLPIVCSNVAPYKRAVTDGVDGYLVSDNSAEWLARLETLILSAEKRVTMGAAGLQSLKSRGYLMPDCVLSFEKALLKICLGKIGRPQCEEAIAKRLAEIGG
jgi:hypothetical protein